MLAANSILKTPIPNTSTSYVCAYTSNSASSSTLCVTVPAGQQQQQTAYTRPPYPTPVPGMFIVYFLHFCPSKTSVCYGCSQTLKPNGVILNQPHDLIVSNMERGGIMVTWCTKNTVMFISTVVVNVCKKGIAVTFTLAFQQACCSF